MEIEILENICSQFAPGSQLLTSPALKEKSLVIPAVNYHNHYSPGLSAKIAQKFVLQDLICDVFFCSSNLRLFTCELKRDLYEKRKNWLSHAVFRIILFEKSNYSLIAMTWFSESRN